MHFCQQFYFLFPVPLIVVELAESGHQFVTFAIVVRFVGNDFAQVVQQALAIASRIQERVAALHLQRPVPVQLGRGLSEATDQGVERGRRYVRDGEILREGVQRGPERVPLGVQVGLGQVEVVRFEISDFLKGGCGI